MKTRLLTALTLAVPTEPVLSEWVLAASELTLLLLAVLPLTSLALARFGYRSELRAILTMAFVRARFGLPAGLRSMRVGAIAVAALFARGL